MSNANRLRLRRQRREAQKSRGNSNAWLITALLIGEESGRDRRVVTAEFRARRAVRVAFAIKHHISIRVSNFIHNTAETRKQDPNTWERYQIDSCVAYLNKGKKA